MSNILAEVEGWSYGIPPRDGTYQTKSEHYPEGKPMKFHHNMWWVGKKFTGINVNCWRENTDYQNDIKALFRVMDEMDRRDLWPRGGAFCCGAALMSWLMNSMKEGDKLTNLAATLYPMLVEIAEERKK